MKKIKLILFIAVLSFPLFAQQQDEYNKGEVFIGYSAGFLLAGNDTFEPADHGFNVAAVYNFHKYIGIKGDVSGTYRRVDGIRAGLPGADHSLYNATVGVQFKNNKVDAKLKPFVHVLAGVAKHEDRLNAQCPTGVNCGFDFNFTGFSLIVGGGLDIKVNRRIDIRLAQLDLNPIGYKDGTQQANYNNTRFSSGIVFKF